MHWRTWAPVDEAIRKEFGYRLEADVATARRLQPHVHRRLRELVPLVRARDLAVVGCGPLSPDMQLEGRTVVAADGAVTWLREQGVVPRIVVTDLDGRPEDLLWAAQEGAHVVVHAHGDNRAQVEELAPRLRPYGTHQGPPLQGLAPLANPGGFTDGDRALVILEHLGARSVRLVGFDFSAPPSRYSHRWDPATKMRKLAWAERIVQGVRQRGRTKVL